MPRKRPEINPNQGSLLLAVPELPEVEQENFPPVAAEKAVEAASEHPIVYGEPGSYVDLVGRAEYLLEALKAMGARNQRVGFDTASNTRQYDGPIWARYKGGVPQVQEGAQANVIKFNEALRQRFWQATGYSALRGLGLAPQKELDAGARKMWRNFNETYGPPESRNRRDTYKRQLTKTIKKSRRVIANNLT